MWKHFFVNKVDLSIQQILPVVSVLVVMELLLVRYSGNGSWDPILLDFEFGSSNPSPILSGPPFRFLPPRLNLELMHN